MKRFRTSSLLRLLFMCGTGLALCSCGSDSILGTGFGSAGAQSPQSQSDGQNSTLSSLKNFVFYGGSTVPNEVPKELAQRTIDCPKIDVLAGTAALRIAKGGTKSDTGNNESAVGVNFQASMGQTARECRVENNRIAIKVGIEGRVLIGTNGQAGTYAVPVRVVVKREKEVIYSKLTRLNISVPNGETQASFTHIEEGINLPLTENNPADEYDILVGFDPSSKMNEVKVKKRG